MIRGLALVVLVGFTLAGCLQDPEPPVGHGFDGDAALQWVEDIVYTEDGSLRLRTPTSAGHDATVDWLAVQLSVDDWDVRRDGFTGADYQDLDAGSAERWTTGCPQEDQDELPELGFTNLYATKQGTGDGHVVLAAHWDAKEDAHGGDGPVPAANDGASGMGVLLQLQRHLDGSDTDLPFHLTIAFFDGEDGFDDCHPLAGSLWAARNGSLGDVSQLILLDMVGDADARFIQDDTSRSSDPALVDAVWAAADGLGLGDRFTDCEGPMLDDHVPFHEEGVAVIDIIDAGHGSGFNCTDFQPYWHTVDDTPDQLSAHMLGAMGDLVLHILTDPGMQALLQD